MPIERPIKVVQARIPAQSPLVGGVEEAVTVPTEWACFDSRDIDGMSVALADADVFIGFFLTPEMTRGAKRLRLVASTGAGYDKIDPRALPQGCAVVNCYDHGPAMAEYIVATVVCLRRRIFEADQLLRKNDWSLWLRHGPLSEGLRGGTLGIIGLGHLGEHLSRLAKAFGMRVIAVTRNPDRDGPERRAHLDELWGIDEREALLSQSDVVVPCVPLTEETRGLIGASELRLMKSTSILVNPSRGPVVDQHALYQALREERIGGAVLDVWWHYPTREEPSPNPADVPFGELSNVLMTPHISAGTIDTFSRRAQVIAANIDRFARGEALINRVPITPEKEQ